MIHSVSFISKINAKTEVEQQPYYLAVQNSYHAIDVALCCNGQVLRCITEDKKHASKYFIALLSRLLQEQQCTFAQVAFMAVNQGPGPFTTLRVIISSVNGLSFATQKPLIGVDGLDALLCEY